MKLVSYASLLEKIERMETRYRQREGEFQTLVAQMTLQHSTSQQVRFGFFLTQTRCTGCTADEQNGMMQQKIFSFFIY
jgi:hypothetical protein